MKKILLIGEPMALLIAEKVGPLEEIENFKRSLSGAEVNVCIGLTRLNHQSIYITRLGEDPFGYYIKNFLDKENISTRFIEFDKVYKTGIQLKSKVLTGDPVAPYYRKGSAASNLSVSDINAIDFDGVGYVHITGIPPALSASCRQATYRLMERAAEHEALITFDPNMRPALWQSEEEMVKITNDLASKADIVMPGVEEGKVLAGTGEPGEIADFYTEMGVKKVIIKIGPKGAYVRENGESYIVDGFKVDNVVDTVGAGDGFAVGVISAIVEGLPLNEAVKRGNAVGAIQVAHPGDNEGLPTRLQLEKFIKEHQ